MRTHLYNVGLHVFTRMHLHVRTQYVRMRTQTQYARA